MMGAVELFSAHNAASRRGMPVEDVFGEREEARRAYRERVLSRRELLAGAAGVAATTAVTVSPALGFARSIARRSAPRVAIVGAGLAGIRCAHRLWNANPARPIASTIFEANPERAGGRCWTLRDYFQSGLITEHGGSFLNTDQHAVRRLARSLGLEEERVDGGQLPQGESVSLIDGGTYTGRQASADWASVGYRVVNEAIAEAGTLAGAFRLDGISVTEWLEGSEIGAATRLGKAMLAATVAESGLDPEATSALVLLEVFASANSKRLSTSVKGFERFHIVGGNDQLITRMLDALPPETLRLGHQLVALRANIDGSYTLVLSVAGSTSEATVDVVVLALPFTLLREVDLSQSGLSAEKREVIDKFELGSNAKIHVELTHKTWPALGYNGFALSEWEGFCAGWDDSVALGPDAGPALYLGFPGGRVGRTGLTGGAHGPAPEQDVSWLLAQLDQLFPGTSATFTGRAYEDHWVQDPWTRGAYSSPGVGQAITYPTIAAAPQGSILFAGEHTSMKNEGFLDGAVETGERAADEIIRRS